MRYGRLGYLNALIIASLREETVSLGIELPVASVRDLGPVTSVRDVVRPGI